VPSLHPQTQPNTTAVVLRYTINAAITEQLIRVPLYLSFLSVIINPNFISNSDIRIDFSLRHTAVNHPGVKRVSTITSRPDGQTACVQATSAIAACRKLASLSRSACTQQRTVLRCDFSRSLWPNIWFKFLTTCTQSALLSTAATATGYRRQ
jgi:hypothetical protein